VDLLLLIQPTIVAETGRLESSDVARESADVVLLGNDLLTFAETLTLARRTRLIIWANFAGTIGVDALGIGLAAFSVSNQFLDAVTLVFGRQICRDLEDAELRGDDLGDGQRIAC
jgi:cation transport ATPase